MTKRITLTLLFILTALSASCWADNSEPAWQPIDQQQLVYMTLSTGTVVIELAPFMAPNTVNQFKALVREGFYNGLDFYRVIDGFVAQGGDITEKKTSQHSQPLAAEFSRTVKDDKAFRLVQSPAFLAPQTGFLHDFPAGRDGQTGEEWLLHCYGTVAMARDNDINSGTTDFYIDIGQAPRHLDRNMSVFGQVIYGMRHVQALPRGEVDNGGVIDDASKRGKIISASLGIDVPKSQQMQFQIQNPFSDDYANKLQQARTLSNPFFHYKGNGNVDVCYRKLKVEQVNN